MLRVSSLDLLSGTLMVAQTVTRDRRGASNVGPPKSAAGRRTLAVSPGVVELLAAHLANRGLSGAEPDALLFVAPGGGLLAYNNWRRRVWAPACEAAGLAGLGFHDLRAAAATTLVAGKVDVRTAQARLGHSDPRLTLAIYAQATIDADRRAADRVGAKWMAESPRV